MSMDSGFPGADFPGQPGIPGQPDFTGAVPFADQPGMLGSGIPGQLPGQWPRRTLQPMQIGRGGPLAVIAAAVFVVGAIIAIIVFVSIAHRMSNPNPSGTCIGGPQLGAPGQSLGNGNYRFTCAGGGSTVVHIGN